MKRKVLFLIALLIPFIVNAKEELTYSWHKTNNNGTAFIVEKDNEYLLLDNLLESKDQTINKNASINFLTPSGKLNRKIALKDFAEENVYGYIDSIIPLLDRLPIPIYINKYNDSYITYMAFKDRIEICNNENEEPTCVFHNISELTETELKNYLGEYYDILDSYNFMDNLQNNHVFHVVKKYQNHYIEYKANLENLRGEITIYNQDKEKVIKQDLDLVSEYASVDINDSGIYLGISEREHRTQEGYFGIAKYDLNGKLEYTLELNDILMDNLDLTEEDLYFTELLNINIVNGGLVLNLSNSASANYMDYCMNHTDVVEHESTIYGNKLLPKYTTADKYSTCINKLRTSFLKEYDPNEPHNYVSSNNSKITPTFLEKSAPSMTINEEALGELIYASIPNKVVKLSLDYEVATKVEGKGNVKVINRSGAGEGVTFVVEPAKGYVLGVVKVTDANGNVIEFNDYTFTMPSSDVLIEVEFVKENPNTTDIAIITIISLAIIFGVVLLNLNKKYKWLK